MEKVALIAVKYIFFITGSSVVATLFTQVIDVTPRDLGVNRV